MFPHTITIYHHEVLNGSDVFTNTVVSGFYVYGGKSIVLNGKGVENSDSITLISSPDMAHTYGTDWKVQKGDRIIRGEGVVITSWKELSDSITVLSIEENIVNSIVDNITITGK